MQFGVTPLLMAIKEGHTEVFKTLVWNGRANLNHQEDVACRYYIICDLADAACIFLSM